MKHLFIVNPTAGGKDKSIAVSRAVRAAFENRDGEYEVYITKAPMDAADKIRAEAAVCEHLRVYACSSQNIDACERFHFFISLCQMNQYHFHSPFSTLLLHELIDGVVQFLQRFHIVFLHRFHDACRHMFLQHGAAHALQG